jgi:branched-chain amino acid transport system permease protein
VLMVCSSVLLSSWTRAWLLYLGLLFLFVVMFSPGGVAGAMATLARRLRQPQAWREITRRPWRVFSFFSAAVGLLALVTLIEMVYHLQWGAVLGSQLLFLGVLLDVQQVAYWAAALLVLLAGGGLWAWSRRLHRRNPLLTREQRR